MHRGTLVFILSKGESTYTFPKPTDVDDSPLLDRAAVDVLRGLAVLKVKDRTRFFLDHWVREAPAKNLNKFVLHKVYTSSSLWN